MLPWVAFADGLHRAAARRQHRFCQVAGAEGHPSVDRHPEGATSKFCIIGYPQPDVYDFLSTFAWLYGIVKLYVTICSTVYSLLALPISIEVHKFCAVYFSIFIKKKNPLSTRIRCIFMLQIPLRMFKYSYIIIFCKIHCFSLHFRFFLLQAMEVLSLELAKLDGVCIKLIQVRRPLCDFFHSFMFLCQTTPMHNVYRCNFYFNRHFLGVIIL